MTSLQLLSLEPKVLNRLIDNTRNRKPKSYSASVLHCV